MPLDNAKNGARATLSAGITAAATTVALTTGHGSRMPEVPFNAWIYNATDYASDPHDDPGYEIVRVTARSTDTLTTVIRAQEGTSAADHNTGGKTYRLVAGQTARTINYEVEPGWYNARANGLMGDGVTDDTVALQALIDRLTPLGGGRIFFPPGTYLMGGALQDTGGRNAQILLPIVPMASNQVCFEFIGAHASPIAAHLNSPTPAAGYSIIKSTLTGASGSAAFIAGKEAVGAAEFWDNVQLIVRDLIFEAPPNPSFTAFNCFNITGPEFTRVVIHAGSVDLFDMVEPTHSNSFAIRLPGSNHSAGAQLQAVNVWGFYNGMLDGELAEIHANFWGCIRAAFVPFTVHVSSYRHFGVFHCPYGIVAAGVGYTGYSHDDGTHYMRVAEYAGERANTAGGFGYAWQERIYDVYDPDNLLYGDVHWLSIQAAVGNTHTFLKNGGENLIDNEIGTTDLPAPPEVASAEIGMIADTTVKVTFTEEVKAADFTDGVIISVAGTPRTITSATRQAMKTVVYFVLSSAVTVGQTVTLSYSQIDGFITNSRGAHLEDIDELNVANTVGVTAFVLDQFIDTEATPLPSHVIAPANAPATAWTNDENTFIISSDKAVPPTLPGISSASCNAGIADCVVCVTVRGTVDTDMGLKFRVQDASNYWIADLRTVSNMFSIVQKNAGTYSVPIETAFSFVADTDYLIEVTLSGSSISATINGGSTLNHSSSFLQTATRYGLWASRGGTPIGSGPSFDDFCVST